MPSADGPGVPFRRRAVSFPCERYPVGAFWGSRLDCRLPRSTHPGVVAGAEEAGEGGTPPC